MSTYKDPVRARFAGARAPWLSVIIFMSTFCALQGGWDAARGSSLGRWVVDDATVHTDVAAIRLLTPQVDAVARGTRVVAPGGGINVANGCDGTEVYFLLLAALATYPFAWRLRLTGLTMGAALIFVMNQARLLALFYAMRGHRALFGQIHGLVGPLVLTVATTGFFLLLLQADQRTRLQARVPHG